MQVFACQCHIQSHLDQRSIRRLPPHVCSKKIAVRGASTVTISITTDLDALAMRNPRIAEIHRMDLPLGDYGEALREMGLLPTPYRAPDGLTFEHLKVYVEAASSDTEWAMEEASLNYTEWEDLTRYARATVGRDYDAVDEKLTELGNVRKAMGQQYVALRPSDSEDMRSNRMFRDFIWPEGKAEILNCGRISRKLRAEFEKAEAKLDAAWEELKARGLGKQDIARVVREKAEEEARNRHTYDWLLGSVPLKEERLGVFE